MNHEGKQEDVSVFDSVLRNDEIEGFLRLVHLTSRIQEQPIAKIEIMPGGLTNKNFKISLLDGTVVAVRLAGKGTASYINRPAEKHNATQMASIGIAPEIYFYDPKSGSQLCEYIFADTMRPLDFQTNTDVLVTAHWSTWSLVQICYGKDEDFYWEYGRTRAVDAFGFMNDPRFSGYVKLVG